MDETAIDAFDHFDDATLETLGSMCLWVREKANELFPGDSLLTPAQVAQVLYNENTRSAANGVRDRLVAGTLIPGLQKHGGRWMIPVDVLDKTIEGWVDTGREARRLGITPAARTEPVRAGKRQWRAAIGPRAGQPGYDAFIQAHSDSGSAWSQVFDAMDAFASQESREAMERNTAAAPKVGPHNVGGRLPATSKPSGRI